MPLLAGSIIVTRRVGWMRLDLDAALRLGTLIFGTRWFFGVFNR
jgi:hypothetical protein